MINKLSVKDELERLSPEESKFISFPFYYNSMPLLSGSEKHACWGMTLLSARSMRFRWNETNENRTQMLKSIFPNQKIAAIELIHSKEIYEAKSENDTKNLKGDGIITKNPLLVPCVTVADCVPIFLYDKKSKVFGAFHSGWKGTGIAGLGVEKLCSLYGAQKEDICAAIGPHIDSCCYFVDEERADYFTKEFGENCISKAELSENDEKSAAIIKEFPYRLSLTNANLTVLKKAGILEENIVLAKDCTCCTSFKNGRNVFGSFRRQAAFLDKSLSADERSRCMTVQAAFVSL